jgi:hypothetical protein
MNVVHRFIQPLSVVLCLLAIGCVPTQQKRQASFLPYSVVQIGDVPVREFLSSRTAFVIVGVELIPTADSEGAYQLHSADIGHKTNIWVKASGGELRFGAVSPYKLPEVRLSPLKVFDRADLILGLAAAIDPRGYYLTTTPIAEGAPVYLGFESNDGAHIQRATVIWSGSASRKAPFIALLHVPRPSGRVFEWADTCYVADRVLTLGLKGGTNSVQRDFFAGTLLAVERKRSPGNVHFEHDAPTLQPGPVLTLDGQLIGIDAVRMMRIYLSTRYKVFNLGVRPDLEWLNEIVEKHNASLSGP